MINFNIKNRLGFTMMELVFVIVVLGTLATLVMPRLDRDIRQEAADNILSAIRYTQHLALNDDKHRFDTFDWQKRLWQIRFSNFNGGWQYSIWSDLNGGGNVDITPGTEEMAIDPLNGKNLHSTDNTQDPGESSDIFLTNNYGITNVTFAGCANPGGTVQSAARHIAFDNLGRPFRGISTATNNYDRYVTTDCRITFTGRNSFPKNPIVIHIKRETGYAFIVDQPSS